MQDKHTQAPKVSSQECVGHVLSVCVCGQLMCVFVDAGKENEYHNMSTDGWKELITSSRERP